MKKVFIVSLLCTVALLKSSNLQAQSNIITTGNNLIDPGNPLAADIVIGSYATVNGVTGIRHDASIMFWNLGSASRIWSGGDMFHFSQWSTTNSNVGLNAIFAGSSFFQGNLGVGTVAPLALLQVDDGCTMATIGDASGWGLGYGTSYLGFNAARNNNSWTLHTDGGNNGGGVIYSGITGDMYFAPVGTTANGTDQTLTDASIKSKITFRIGADGITYAKKIKVELTDWPDFVFKPNYKLKSLSEVKTYIDLNHHLPDMPSEKEVGDKGIDLGEMNKLLVKKVEELTLYLIEKDKKDNEQQKQIDQLKKKVEEITAKL